MKVEIWSDIMCPFCYLGKRKFEKALEQFPYKNEVEVEWKSFQLNPEMKTRPGVSINQYLAEVKGVTPDQAKQMNDRVTAMAKEAGLEYEMDRAVVANSFNAHRLIQFAKQNGKGDEMEERLFQAYFTEGKNIDDNETLHLLATEIGLDSNAVTRVLETDAFSDKVEEDIYQAQQIGVRGIPYFVLNDRHAVSGAQASETFAGALNKAFGEWEKEHQQSSSAATDSASVCSPGGDC